MTQFHGMIEEKPLTEEQVNKLKRKFGAFPVQKYEGSWQDGMTLRDYFAAKAVASIFDNSNLIFEDEDYKEAATIAYKFADAMMKAREE